MLLVWFDNISVCFIYLLKKTILLSILLTWTCELINLQTWLHLIWIDYLIVIHMISFQNYEHHKASQLTIRQSSGDQFAYNWFMESTNLLFEFIKLKELIELQFTFQKQKKIAYLLLPVKAIIATTTKHKHKQFQHPRKHKKIRKPKWLQFLLPLLFFSWKL